MSPELAQHLEKEMAQLNERRVQLRLSDYRLIWVLVDLLELDFGREATETVIAKVCEQISDDTTYSKPGQFLHFLAEGIAQGVFCIIDKGEDGGTPASREIQRVFKAQQ